MNIGHALCSLLQFNCVFSPSFLYFHQVALTIALSVTTQQCVSSVTADTTSTQVKPARVRPSSYL